MNRMWVPVGLLALAVTGCYESRVPMASGSNAALDPRLLGSWVRVTAGQGADSLLFLEFDSHQYYAAYRASGDPLPSHFRVYLVAVGEAPFLNAQDIGQREAKKRTYFFFRYELAGDSLLTLRMVSDRLLKPKPSTSKELTEFLRKNLTDPQLYEQPEKFRRLR